MGRILRTFLRMRIPATVATMLVCLLADGQSPVAPIGQPETALDVLHQLSDAADVIFAGQVLTIHRPNGAEWGPGVVEIEFRIDQAVRGCSAGSPYILREWGGLWAGGGQRYRVGQRFLMLLHAPSDAGMSSPVGGLDGAIPIRQGGPATGPVDSSTAPQPFVDLRWFGARLTRAVSYRSEEAHAGKPASVAVPVLSRQATQVATSRSIVSAAPIVATFGNADAGGSSVPAQQASVDAVIDMLTSWQKALHVVP